jgi:alanyl-tRNA synthetase
MWPLGWRMFPPYCRQPFFKKSKTRRSTLPGPCEQNDMINRVARQQEGMAQELKSISRALTEIAEQRKDIEHLLEHQRDHRSWLKNHETRVQELEAVQRACPIADIKSDMTTLRDTPGKLAAKVLYLVAVAALGWLAGVLQSGGIG